MTKEQALKDMQERCRICKRDALPTEKECANCYFPIAIESIEKQIQMKPKFRRRTEGTIQWFCGRCNAYHWNDHELDYCSRCGQKVKYKGVKDD